MTVSSLIHFVLMRISDFLRLTNPSPEIYLSIMIVSVVIEYLLSEVLRILHATSLRIPELNTLDSRSRTEMRES